MAARPSDATNVVVSAPKRSQELSDTTNRVLLAHSAHRHYEYDSLSAKSSQALRICAQDVLHHHAFGLVRPAASLRTPRYTESCCNLAQALKCASFQACLADIWLVHLLHSGVVEHHGEKKERCAKGGTSSCPRAMQIHVKFRCARILSNGEHMSVQWCRCGRLSQAMLQYL